MKYYSCADCGKVHSSILNKLPKPCCSHRLREIKKKDIGKVVKRQTEKEMNKRKKSES